MDQRKELLALASQPAANRRQLSKRWGISAKTLYKWLQRYERDGMAALADQSLRPVSSPLRTSSDIEQPVLSLRDAHPCWRAQAHSSVGEHRVSAGACGQHGA